jgi:uncharacterized protein (TIGR03437 family)
MKTAQMKRLWLLFLCAPSLFGYAHFLHYTADGQVLPEKYNLIQLPLKTVTFYVSTDGPTSYDPNDSFPSVVNQIRQATLVWNGVKSSDLRVAFGGLYVEGSQDNSPGGDVVFEQMPPGVLAYSGPTTCEDLSATGPCVSQIPMFGDTYLPILRSTMHMSINLTQLPGPSFSELYYLVAVHEMGHALGLQHTFTSSSMSTFATRATSLSKPIDVDDIAGISQLYPTLASSSQYGSISGTITYSTDNSPVHMASVVAIAAGAPAVSTLTLPDGSFEIDGIPPGQYFLYVHPLPPTADIISPVDQNGNSVNPTSPFSAAVYPGVMSLLRATSVPVVAGQISSGYNMSVAPLASVPIYDVSMYSYPGSNAIHPAYVNDSQSTGVTVASGVGLTSGAAAAQGLNVQVLGGNASVQQFYPYSDSAGDTYLAVDLAFSNFATNGPQHMIFSTPNYLYLLPNAVSCVQNAVPVISSVVPNPDGSVTVSGQGFQPNTLIYFDALPATVATVDVTNGVINLVPPSGASDQTATLTAYNSDGQNSMFLQVNAAPTYSYSAQPATSLAVSPSSLPAGAEARVDIIGTNTNFVQGRTAIGFGTHDLVVRNTFVVSPTHVIVDVSIPAGAAQITDGVTALTDFQLATAPQAFQVSAPQPGLPAAVPILFNDAPLQTGAYPGATLSFYGTNLQAPGNPSPTVTFNGQVANLLYASPYQINLTLPSGLAPGLATLLVNNGSLSSYPVVVTINPAEPVVTSLQLAQGPAIVTGSPVIPGETVDAFLTGFGTPGELISPSRVQVNLNGTNYPVQAVTQVPGSAVFEVTFTIPATVAPGQQIPLVIFLDGLSSVPSSISIAAAP